MQAEELRDMGIGGLDVNYFVLCPRKLWWYSHGLNQEDGEGAAGQENVALGRHVHEESYSGETQKDVMIDGIIRMDFTDDGVVHEVKKSKGGEQASRYQLLYYLYYLKHVKGIVTTGVIDYPLIRRREQVELNEQREREIEQLLTGINQIRKRSEPPAVEHPIGLCAKCAYQELCWG